MPSDEPDDAPVGRVAVIDIGRIAVDIDRGWAVVRRGDPATSGTVARHRHMDRTLRVVGGTAMATASIREPVEEGLHEAWILDAFPALVPADATAEIEHGRG